MSADLKQAICNFRSYLYCSSDDFQTKAIMALQTDFEALLESGKETIAVQEVDELLDKKFGNITKLDFFVLKNIVMSDWGPYLEFPKEEI